MREGIIRRVNLADGKLYMASVGNLCRVLQSLSIRDARLHLIFCFEIKLVIGNPVDVPVMNHLLYTYEPLMDLKVLFVQEGHIIGRYQGKSNLFGQLCCGVHENPVALKAMVLYFNKEMFRPKHAF